MKMKDVSEGVANPKTIQLLTGKTDVSEVCDRTISISNVLIGICLLDKYPTHIRHETKNRMLMGG